MPNYSLYDVVLVRFPFSDPSKSKVRPAVIVGYETTSVDLFIVPLTSRTKGLRSGEFVMGGWSEAGLSIETAVKRGLHTIQDRLILRKVGTLTTSDIKVLTHSLTTWLHLES